MFGGEICCDMDQNDTIGKIELNPLSSCQVIILIARIVAFWVTNPCRITRKVKQTKMYVCTLEEFILVDIWIHCCASWK